MTWHKSIISKLEASGLFTDVMLVGGKIRAHVSEVRFLDIHFDPKMRSYSYALIDLTLTYPGDKRIFGWDDFPHEGIASFKQLESYPHHFQRRAQDGSWIFEASQMCGNIEIEVEYVLDYLRTFLR